VFHVERAERTLKFHVEQLATKGEIWAGSEGGIEPKRRGLAGGLFHREVFFGCLLRQFDGGRAIASGVIVCGPAGRDKQSSFPQRGRVVHN